MDRQTNRYEKSDAEPADERKNSLSANHNCCDCANNNNNNNNSKHCLPDERYLTRSTEGSRKRAQRKAAGHKTASDLGAAGSGQEIDQDMIRVLVTKPEIAGKPRDNIVFEGDMDLKTTFETSYENLAKMRLDYWKQRQQLGLSAEQQEQGVSAEELVELDRHSSATSESSGSDVDESDRHQPATNSLHGIVSATSISKQEVDGANEDATYKLSSKKVDYPSESIPSQPYIDPDLSSIIVYDANMNRLEKVGVRKRSKYRPSTSLCTGARGLFGDQSEDKVESQAHYDTSTTSNNKMLGSKAYDTKQVPNGHSEGRGLALDARNLHSSKQVSHLTYSTRNLPVDSKRKLKDNVNMRDHIKEQNICAKHNDDTLAAATTTTTNMVDRINTQANDYLDNLKLAQQEEEAAVEELQRVTLLPVQDTESMMSHKDGPSDASAKSNPNSRQSRLERTCQNQSFYLFENEYPEQKQKGGGETGPRLGTGTQSHRHQASYNNLFRESPDFILATKGYFETDYKSTTPNEAQTKLVPKVQLDEHASKKESVMEPEINQVVFRGEQKKSISPIECRVLRLDKEFEYVGSQGGHSYFTEKELKVAE